MKYLTGGHLPLPDRYSIFLVDDSEESLDGSFIYLSKEEMNNFVERTVDVIGNILNKNHIL